MIIDIHTHVADIRTPAMMDRAPVTFENLIARLDEEGIDKAVLLPLGNTAESTPLPFIFSEYPDVVSLLREGARHPNRLILFGCFDPRMGGNKADTDFSWILDRFIEMGCVGIGEVTPNLQADDPRVVNMFRQCGKKNLPLIIHGNAVGAGSYGLTDIPGSPHLARLLAAAPEATVIGHGPGFWAEIGGGLTLEQKALYPQGTYSDEGSLWRLLRTYPNLYADISANSGRNAIARNEEAGIRFLNEFQDKVLFGSDVCFGDAQGRMPHLAILRGMLAKGQISRTVFDKITVGNALKVMPRYKG